MSWLLDTCALSEKLRKRPDKAFVKWLEAQDPEDYYISVLSIGEIRKGIDLLAKSEKRRRLDDWFTGDLIPFFEGRILGIGPEEAIQWGRSYARCQSKGYKPPVIDSLLAAIAQVNNLTLVTRNEKDFIPLEVSVVNPWSDA